MSEPNTLDARRATLRAQRTILEAERARLRESLVAGEVALTGRLTGLGREVASLEAELAELDLAATTRAQRAARAETLRRAAAVVADVRARLTRLCAPDPQAEARRAAAVAAVAAAERGRDEALATTGGHRIASVLQPREHEVAVAKGRLAAEEQLAAQGAHRAQRREAFAAVDAALEGAAGALTAAADAVLRGAPPDLAAPRAGLVRARDGLVRLANVPEETSARAVWQGFLDQLERASEVLRG